MARLLEFIHGGTFVAKPEDLRIAVDCAAFFGVPSLLHHVREWIAGNLKVTTAPTLWRFVETEPLLKMQDSSAKSMIAIWEIPNLNRMDPNGKGTTMLYPFQCTISIKDNGQMLVVLCIALT
ncbi:Hypothetical protein SCF082_LOCUS21134 [Durusdinium trenchii]|uniref:Uncharacterized protein n=1 Tax=Durusdinium trenchii TaxID=1381693 RepID=A0ABP0L7F9_9DINO